MFGDTSIEIDLEIHFLIFSDADKWFIEKELISKGGYIVVEALSISQQVKFINRMEIATAMFDKNKKNFVMHC